MVKSIDGRDNSVEFLNGIKIFAGDVIGKVSEDQLRRIQIRETILSHIRGGNGSFSIRASRFCRCSSSTRLQNTSSTTRLDIRSTASMRICSRKNTTTFSAPCSRKSETGLHTVSGRNFRP